MKTRHPATRSGQLQRLRCVLGASVLSAIPIGVTSVAFSPVAGAATTVTVTPNTDIFSGTSLKVQGSTTITGNLLVIECSPGDVSIIGRPYDPNQCDSATTVTTTVDSSGNYSATFTFEDPLATPNGSVDCSVAGTCVIVVDNPSPADVVAESPMTGNSCNGVFNGADSGRSFKSTYAGPNGSTVMAGQTIWVTLKWTPSYWTSLSKTFGCVSVNGTISPTLSAEHKPPSSNSGSDTFSYVIPFTAIPGDKYCDRGAVSGTPGTTQKTNKRCYTVVGPGTVTPAFSPAVGLPYMAGGIGLGALAVGAHRRRRRAISR